MLSFEHKICQPCELVERIAALPRPRVMTNGVFDLLHRGHVSYLAQARELGASLVVAVNSDHSVRRLNKSAERPVNTCDDRMALLAALASTSLITVFDDATALPLVTMIQPDIYVKGADYPVEQTPEGRAVSAYGGRAVAIPFLHYTSTTALIARLRARPMNDEESK